MSKDFFINSLNYAMANEDSALERAIVTRLKPAHILSVCGSGSRAFPLITSTTKALDLIDLSQTQLDLAKLREKTIKEWDYSSFIRFWGYKDLSPEQRQAQFEKLLIVLPDSLKTIFSHHNFSAPIYYGAWEKTYQKLNRLVRLIIGERLINKLANAQTLEHQKKVYYSRFFRMRWMFVLIFVGNRALFNSLLYKGGFVQKTIPESYVAFYLNAFDRLIERVMLKKSYFLQMSFLGKIKFPAGSPCEVWPEVYGDVASNIENVKINYLEKNIIEYLSSVEKRYNFISLSDVPSYFDEALGKDFVQQISPSMVSGAVIVIRYYLNIKSPNIAGFEDITYEFQNEIENEQVQMYQVQILRKK